jgi:hypothetical protein
VPSEPAKEKAALRTDGEEPYRSFELFDSYFFRDQDDPATSANAPVRKPLFASTS